MWKSKRSSVQAYPWRGKSILLIPNILLDIPIIVHHDVQS